ncbi:MAG: PQQ-dependent sugar dehydrogenase [Acidimicrobiia bacterium]
MSRLVAVIVGMLVLLVELFSNGPSISAAPVTVPPVESSTVMESDPLVGLEATLVASGFDPLTDVVGSPVDDRLFVVEKQGRIMVVDHGATLPQPFLDITDWTYSAGNEQGLLTLLFHPDFAHNRRFFVFFTDRDADSRLVEMKVMASDPNRVDPASVRDILEVPQHLQYHQSGSMVFGPDGMLWLSIGDGGGEGDPELNGQNPTNLYATVLRIDVDHGDPYSIPQDNPFVDSPNGERPEIWAYGVRNPWRITIDPQTGYLVIPDVGQEGSEEVDLAKLDDGGRNFGWSTMEGTSCFRDESCDPTGITPPIFEYLHNGYGCAIVGGPVYRGAAIPELDGQYFYADYCIGWVRSLKLEDGQVVQRRDWEEDLQRKGNVSTIGTDRNGEMYIVNLGGEVWRIDPVRESDQG